jgi:hypothetical protein
MVAVGPAKRRAAGQKKICVEIHRISGRVLTRPYLITTKLIPLAAVAKLPNIVESVPVAFVKHAVFGGAELGNGVVGLAPALLIRFAFKQNSLWASNFCPSPQFSGAWEHKHNTSAIRGMYPAYPPKPPNAFPQRVMTYSLSIIRAET